MTKKQFTKREVIQIIKKQFTNFYRIWSDDMNLGEKLLFSNIEDSVINGVDYNMRDIDD